MQDTDHYVEIKQYANIIATILQFYGGVISKKILEHTKYFYYTAAGGCAVWWR